jgi:hypothetical protein
VADPAIVLLILLAGDAADPATQAVVPAVRRPLGDRAVVLVQQTESPPSDAEALAIARNAHAVSAASLEWEDPARSRVRLRVLRVQGPERYEYELTFGATDAPDQRGRAAGLALAPLLVQALAGAPSTTPAGETGGTPAGAAAPSPPTTEREVPPAPPPAASSPAPASEARRRFRLDTGATGSVGLGGSALGAGPFLGLECFVLGPLSLRALAFGRFGEVSAASAFSSAAAVGGGAGWQFARLGSGIHELELSVSADVLAMQHALVRRANGATVARDRWVTAVEATFDGAFRVSTSYELFVNLGAEVAAGPTVIAVGGVSLDHIPVVRVVGGLGVRVRF